MNRGDAVSIPARLTVEDLAGRIDVDLESLVAELTSRDEPSSPDDFVGAEVARSAARRLGKRVIIEPRDLALEALYEYESRGELLAELDGRAAILALGVVDHRESLDRSIEEASEHWSVARMPLIDRNILRLGLYELQFEPETPSAVIISEAVRLAQTYSTERSGSFVNGVLATLAAATRD